MIKISHFQRSSKPKYIFVDNSMKEFWLFYLNTFFRDTDSIGVWRIKYKNQPEN